MSAKNAAALLFLLTLPIAAHAQAAADELPRLRAEIATLRARNEVLERACPAAAGTISATVTPAASVNAAPASTSQPTAAAALVNLSPKPYSNTGCDRGLFSGPPPGKWQDGGVWRKVGSGMTMAEVETAIGVDHYDEEKDQSVQWQYGRCGGRWAGSVTFVNGLAVSTSPPEP